jgi:hypothetical protein
MNPNQENKFSASQSALGYLYQCRFALFEGLSRLRRGEQFDASLETLDDVVFEEEGKPLELIQMKHHLTRSADLSDASVDIWKSLRIWSVGIKQGTIGQGALLFLVTTAQAAKGSAADYLKPGTNRDTSKALQHLSATVESSTNKTNKPAYDAFRDLTYDQKKSLVGSVFVVDNAPAIEDIETKLNEVLYYAVENKYLEAFMERLEGWWLRRCIRHLARKDLKPILSEELVAETTEIREQFKQDNLPIDDDIMDASIDATGYHDQTFVHQLRLIEIGNKRIFAAIQNYFRAFMHRSRWLRDELVGVGELERYEDRLVEEWQIYFERMSEDLGDSATEVEKKKAAKALYAWVETSHFPIRTRVNEPSITRGSYQILSDSLRVGWHIEFRERIRMLLEQQEVKK